MSIPKVKLNIIIIIIILRITTGKNAMFAIH